MLQIVVGLVGLSIVAMLYAPTVKLALMPVYSQKQKNNHAIAEAQAILIRKQVVNDTTTFACATGVKCNTTDNIKTETVVTSLNNATDPNLKNMINGCTIQSNYTPSQSTLIIPKAVECIVGTGQFKAVVWQPLYTSTNLTESTQAYTAAELTADNMGDAVDLCANTIIQTLPTSNPASICGTTFSNNYSTGGKNSKTTLDSITITISSTGAVSSKINYK